MSVQKMAAVSRRLVSSKRHIANRVGLNYTPIRAIGGMKTGDTVGQIDTGLTSSQTPVKPFSAIPGPRGWPIIGNMPFYTSSKLSLILIFKF